MTNTWCVKLSTENDFKKMFYVNSSTNQYYTHSADTVLETLFPIFIAVLEVRFRTSFHLVGLQPFECFFRLCQNNVPSDNFSILGREKSHKDSSQANKEAEVPHECFCWPKTHSQ